MKALITEIIELFTLSVNGSFLRNFYRNNG